MTTLEQLYELRDRLERATGPDREIDLLIERVGTGLPLRWCDHGVTYDRFGPGAIGNPVYTEPAAYTASLDAIAALHERLLPGWEWSLVRLQDGTFDACLSGPGIGWGNEFTAPTPALAWLRAIVAALIAQKENENEN